MTMSFQDAVRKFGVKTLDRVDKIRRASCLELFTLIITGTPVDTGHLRGNWQTSINAPASAGIDRLDKGGAAAIAEALANLGGLADVVYLVNNLPYAKEIEHGHSAQAPNGMVRLNVLRWSEIVAAKAKGY